MTPIYLNSSSNDQYNEHQFLSPTDHHNGNQFLSPNSQASSSSNSLTCHLFFNSTIINDQDGGFHGEPQPSQHQSDKTLNDHCVENQDERSRNNGDGLKFSLWKRETNYDRNDENQVKWMSSKMRVMLKMKKSDPTKLNTFRSTPTTEMKLQDHHDPKEPTSSPMEETANSNSNNNTPIRVCSDCNTTKTPLWRSGPQGPKSLCNACGIRQRKARKAMAAAAAAATAETNKNLFINDKPTSLKATKILHKKSNNGHIKKRQYSKPMINMTSPSSSSPARKNCVEEFLVSLSKSLAFHCMFPQDEKEAAILLMALSCGYAHHE
uniref:GATA21 n=1 Tax=Carthamus tinctorius TaxID=4222 RepID=A0A6M3RE22_CARTI|nr:GATA21 [Carthamus tinctorius]